MVLGFKTQMIVGKQLKATKFEKRIVEGVKIHTIREDKRDRWREGKKIHFAVGVRTAKYRQFHESECTGVQDITIHFPVVMINDIPLSPSEIRELAVNDGFDNVEVFWSWFNQYPNFVGKLIHWTDKRYRDSY